MVAVDEHIAGNLSGLLAERVAQGSELVADVEQALRAFVAAADAWTAEQQDVAGLLRSADVARTQRLHDLPVAQLARDARQAANAGVPLPLPFDATPVRIAAHDDPDPEVRAAARARVVADKAA